MSLSENKNKFQEEQNDLLKVILNERFFKPYQENNGDPTSMWNNTEMELYITNACNQHCEYCYLVKHPELYNAPKDPETLLHNLRLLLDYLMENNYAPRTLDLFSGEIWHTQLGFDILETIYEYVQNGWPLFSIMIASNCSFVNDPIVFHKMQTLINKFNQTTQTQLHFSISVDGKYVDEITRPRNDPNAKYLDGFYDRLFAFAKRNIFYFHPMVSAKNVKYWIENYKWWEENLLKHNLNPDDYLMLLEVRNPDWTEEAIEDYNKFIDFLVEKKFKEDCNSDIAILSNTFLNLRTYNVLPLNGYFPWVLNPTYSYPGCTVGCSMTVRLGDLAICPCHRQAYDKYLYGHFVVENDEIVDIEANNVNMAIQLLMTNVHHGYHGCDSCIYGKICLQGCYGAQLEELGDPFFPIENVCNFFRKKYGHLLELYEKYGIIDYALQVAPSEPLYENAAMILELYHQWKGLSSRGVGKI